MDYKKALKTIKSEELKGNNPIPDIFGFQHVDKLFQNNFEEKLNKYFDLIINNKKIKNLLRIDVPKGNYTIRPMSRPHLEELIIYESIIDDLSTKVFSAHPDVCKCSYSVIKYKEKINRSISPWLMFDNKAREFYHNNYKSVVITDITGYYENINLEELRSRLFNFIDETDENKNIVKTLFELLRKWSNERISNYGLPQGPAGSSFLGDIFLDHVDRKMEKYEGYFRYMDDIKIFCKSELETKIALKDLIIALRDLKLNINAKKTDILHNEKIEKIFDPHHELMTFTDKIIESKKEKLIEEIAVPSLLMLFEESFTDTPFEKRYLNFSLFRLGVLYNSNINFNYEEIIEKIIINFAKRPHHTGIFCDFLSNFDTRIDIFKNIMDFLKSNENIYEWQEMKLLQCLLRFRIDQNIIDNEFFINQSKNKNNHTIVNCFYLILTGKYGNNRDRDLLIELYNEKEDDYYKMALILSLQELGSASRNDFYNRLNKNEQENIKDFIKYVKSLKNPIYFLKVEKQKIETYKEFEPSMHES